MQRPTRSSSTARQLAAFIAERGPIVERLPWRRPSSARAWLDIADRALVEAAIARIAGSWRSPRPELELAQALASLDPDGDAVLFPGAPSGGPPWFARARRDGGTVPTALVNHHLLSECRNYDLEERDRFTDRPVSLPTLLALPPLPNDRMLFVEGLLEPNDIDHQLRMVVHLDGRVALFAGLLRARGTKPHDERMHALLFALRPALRRWVRVARAIGVAPLGDSALVATLAALDRPALLVGDGRVLYANAPGEPLVEATEAWSATDRRVPFATTAEVRPDGLTLELVLPRSVSQPDPRIAALSSSLREVAEAMMDGLADKEIADELGVSLSTARTYASRVLAQLGLHSRRELMRLRR